MLPCGMKKYQLQMKKLNSSVDLPNNDVSIDEVFSNSLGRLSSLIPSPDPHWLPSYSSDIRFKKT
ncbi:conserved hypothetical protein [Ricinus communis]|uniref:Uncharacterized protein n=1 Tax=Ricinus communis TaxID=3988 RepID=B9SMC1_RICCO|nr:conserved hypothetical protein [Ricinus communis]